MSANMVKEQLMSLFRQKNFRYTDLGGAYLEVYMPGKAMDAVPCTLLIAADGLTLIDVRCQKLINFKEKQANGLLACNQANQQSTIARFYTNEQGEAIAQTQLVYGGSVAYAHALLMISLFASDVDKNYSMLAKMRWA